MNQNKFIEELKKINININEDQLAKLEKYYELLIEYNKVMNLTGITEKEQVYLKHFYDSLTIYKVIDLNNVDNLCDIGTGAGFPGIVLKILFPNLKITLVDSLNKRINFLNIVIKELNLKNIETIHSRIEEYGKDNREKFDVVTCRAVAPLNVLLEYSIPMVKKDKYFIPLKGTLDNENDTSNAIKKLDVILEKKEEFLLPIENSKRTILVYKKLKNTNKKYPRKNLDIKQKPL
jgi:16S rRNA (guanine527-N7)-methyltransferase